jgi:Na+/melibiose symporter-like transporter
MIGGLLARPAESFPDLFGENAFLKAYPYFLPCAISATLTFIAWLVTLLFLKETHPSPVSIGQLFNITTDRKKHTFPNDIGSTDSSIATIPRNLEDDCPQAERPLPLRYLLTPRILISSGNYASVSLVEISFRAIQPLFFSTPIQLGGLGLPLPMIGTLLSVQGILGGIFQAFFFSRIHDRWGSKKTFIAGVASAIPLFITFPLANAFARTQGYSVAVWVAIGIQIITGISLGLAWG